MKGLTVPPSTALVEEGGGEGLPEVFRAFGLTGCQIRLISAFFPKIRLTAILIRKIGKLSDMIHDMI